MSNIYFLHIFKLVILKYKILFLFSKKNLCDNFHFCAKSSSSCQIMPNNNSIYFNVNFNGFFKENITIKYKNNKIKKD